MTKNITMLFLLVSMLAVSACSEESPLVSKTIAETLVSVNKVKQGEALTPEAIKIILEKKLPGIKISGIEPSPKEGIFQVFYNGQILYVTDDGEFVFTGNLLGLIENGPVNLTEEAMMLKSSELAPERAKVIAAISEKDMVVFKAKDEKHVISVFTDVDCAYCRKLHKEVPQLNASGVTVRYLAFPRAGVGSSAYDKLVSVWCADDKQQAMNNAKLKRQFSPKSCTNPVASQYQLTREFGLSGTPALLLSDGELIAGYAPHDELIKHLENKAEQKAAAAKKAKNAAES
ncbi:MAG: thioredoxin fold domain-containing protein [Kangiellaceae bacterium]|nr:thioredoxin fold domain-containing protein [Kangiellaceae bacterium]